MAPHPPQQRYEFLLALDDVTVRHIEFALAVVGAALSLRIDCRVDCSDREIISSDISSMSP
jgi:hypothetical protein